MFTFSMLPIWMERIGCVLIHSLWQFVLVVLAAFVLQRILHRSAAAARYHAMLAAMAVMVALPVATWFSPWSAETPAVVVDRVPAPKGQASSPSTCRDDATPATSLPAAMQEAKTTAAEPMRIGLTSCVWKTREFVRPRLFNIVLAWIAGVMLFALRPLVSWCMLFRLRTVGVSPVGSPVQELWNRLAQMLRVSGAVDILQTTLAETPMVVGCFRPAVLLPMSIITGLPAAQLELILAHELAHIYRHDYLVNVLQTLVETVFFYHPGVWWLSREIRREREYCCDDVAIGVAGGRAEYGRALVAIEELRAASSILSLAAHGGSLLARIQRIAGCQPPPRLAGGSSVFCILLVSVAAYLSVAANAAPPEEGTDRPPAASEARPAIDASDVVQTPSPDMAVSKGIWSLTLREAIRCALQNSRIMREIGAGVATQPESSGSNNAASAAIGDSTGAAPNGPDRMRITRLNNDIPLPEFEAKVNTFVRDVEAAYWDWYGNCRRLETVLAARDSALARWRQIEKSYHAGERGGDPRNEAMAREQYYLFLQVVQADQSSAQTAEAKLRDLLGLAPADKRHIRPADDPTTDRVCFDSLQAMSETAGRLPVARESRHLVKQRELELTAVKEYSTSHKGERKVGAAMRNATLALARERVRLQETELEIVHQLDSAIRDQEASFALLQAALDGRAAAQRRMDKATADYENGDAVFDTAFDAVFQCQGELSTAEIDYYRAVGNYAKSIAMVHYRKGSLLDYHGVHLAENSTQNADGIEN